MTVAPLVVTLPFAPFVTEVIENGPSTSESLDNTGMTAGVLCRVDAESLLAVGGSLTEITVMFTVAVAVAPSESVIV